MCQPPPCLRPAAALYPDCLCPAHLAAPVALLVQLVRLAPLIPAVPAPSMPHRVALRSLRSLRAGRSRHCRCRSRAAHRPRIPLKAPAAPAVPLAPAAPADRAQAASWCRPFDDDRRHCVFNSQRVGPAEWISRPRQISFRSNDIRIGPDQRLLIGGGLKNRQNRNRVFAA